MLGRPARAVRVQVAPGDMPLIVAENEALRSKSEGFLLRNRGIHHLGVFKPKRTPERGVMLLPEHLMSEKANC